MRAPCQKPPHDRTGRPHREGATIALAYGTGLIERAAGATNLVTGSNVAANEIGRAFRAAVRDPAVHARSRPRSR